MPVRLNGSTSGYTELSAPAVAGNNSISFPTGNGTAYQILRNGATAGTTEFTDKIVSETAKAWNWNGLTTNTSIDFTGIPSWVKRVTVMFSGVSTSGTSQIQIQLGTSTSFETTGYDSVAGCSVAATGGTARATTGFIIDIINATYFTAASIRQGAVEIVNLSANTWCSSGNIAQSSASAIIAYNAGTMTIGSALTRIRITTVNGTDTFDAGSINIMYE